MKKVVLIILVGLYSIEFVQSQEIDSGSKPEKKTEFGFNLGAFHTLIKSDDPLPNNYTINNSVGFRLGVLMNHHFGKRFSISPKAELGFSNSELNYSEEPDINISNSIYNTHLEFMTHLIWKRSDLKTNPYILLGPSVRLPLTSENEVSLTNSFDAGIDIGLGFHKALTNFNIMPELRLSSGFMNIMKDENSPHIRYTSISLILNFLG